MDGNGNKHTFCFAWKLQGLELGHVCVIGWEGGDGHVVERAWRPESKCQLVGTKPNSLEGNSSSEWWWNDSCSIKMGDRLC